MRNNPTRQKGKTSASQYQSFERKVCEECYQKSICVIIQQDRKVKLQLHNIKVSSAKCVRNVIKKVYA